MSESSMQARIRRINRQLKAQHVAGTLVSLDRDDRQDLENLLRILEEHIDEDGELAMQLDDLPGTDSLLSYHDRIMLLLAEDDLYIEYD